MRLSRDLHERRRQFLKRSMMLSPRLAVAHPEDETEAINRHSVDVPELEIAVVTPAHGGWIDVRWRLEEIERADK
jgi:hypothetical protein